MKNQLDKWGIDQGMIWGGLLVVGGLLFLLQSLGLFRGAIGAIGNILAIVIFAVGSFAFLGVFLNSPKTNWWAAIPGFTLFGLLIMSVADYFGSFIADLSGGFFLASIGLGFLAIYLFNRELWWTIIPFGTLTTLGVTAAVDELAARGEWTNFDSGSIFFIGLGLTFLLLALMPSSGESTRWAVIPAAVLLIMGILTGSNLETLITYAWPLALIGIGAFLVIRSRKKQRIYPKQKVEQSVTQGFTERSRQGAKQGDRQGDRQSVAPTAVEPTIIKPSVVEPSVVEPSVVEPTISKPDAVEPTIIKPSTVEPIIIKPSTVEPIIVEPSTVETSVVKAETVEQKVETEVEQNNVRPTRGPQQESK